MTMSRKLFLRTCGALLVAGRLGAGAVEPPKEDGLGDAAVWSRIDAFVRSQLEAEKIPGIALAVVERSGRSREGYWGVSDLRTGAAVGPATLFQIGSLSKAFAGVLLLRLSEAGSVDLDAPVTKYLKWFEAPGGSRPPTLHQLLTHTAGLPADRGDIPSPTAQAWAVRERRPPARHGAAFHYSNIGYQILGLVAEQAGHRSFSEMLAREIFSPLGMSTTKGSITFGGKAGAATGYVPLLDDRPPHPDDPLLEAAWIEYSGADGCILSTAPDMAKWMRMILARGAGPSERLLSEESFERLVHPWVRVSPFEPTAYGYGFFVRQVDGRTALRHTGGMLGFTSALAADLGRGLGVVVLTNVARADSRPTEVAEFVLRTLVAARQGEALPEVPPVDRTRVPAAREYAGTFVAPTGDRLVLTAQDDRLFLLRGGARFPLEPHGEDRFWVGHPDFRLHLLRFGRQNGRVVEASYGPSWYATDAYDGPRTFNVPREAAPFRGHYRATNPWANNFRVYFRKGRLLMETLDGAELVLAPVEPGLYRLGEERTPEYVGFDEIVDGWAQRANLSGVEYYRVFTP
jgi:D-alanyl-D-alanine carboxypeptidase